MTYVCPTPGCTHVYDSPVPIKGYSHVCTKLVPAKRVECKEGE